MKINQELEYKKLPINTELSETGIIECLKTVGPAFVYEMFVNPEMLLEARRILLDLNIDLHENSHRHRGYDENPLRPYINLHTNSTLGRREWVIGAKDILAGSPGVL